MTRPDSGLSTARTMDHVTPRVLGGTFRVPCCLACNQLKGDMTAQQWVQFMHANPEWWRLYREHGGRTALRLMAAGVV